MLPINILMIFSLGLFSSSYASDFCVADLEGPKTPFGYTCKKVSNVTVDDFVFSKLGEPANFSTTKSTVFIRAIYVEQFPGLNGLGMTAARLELDVGTVMPLHNRRGANQILFVTEGTMGCGFIASDNTVYYKTLKKGEAMIVPQGMLQFQACMH